MDNKNPVIQIIESSNPIPLDQVPWLKQELEYALKDKIITEDEYSRSISELAYVFAINGQPEDCIIMLANVKNDYFKNAAIQHFRQDSGFHNRCSTVLEIFEYCGWVDSNYEILATQPKGRA